QDPIYWRHPRRADRRDEGSRGTHHVPAADGHPQSAGGGPNRRSGPRRHAVDGATADGVGLASHAAGERGDEIGSHAGGALGRASAHGADPGGHEPPGEPDPWRKKRPERDRSPPVDSAPHGETADQNPAY